MQHIFFICIMLLSSSLFGGEGDPINAPALLTRSSSTLSESHSDLSLSYRSTDPILHLPHQRCACLHRIARCFRCRCHCRCKSSAKPLKNLVAESPTSTTHPNGSSLKESFKTKLVDANYAQQRKRDLQADNNLSQREAQIMAQQLGFDNTEDL